MKQNQKIWLFIFGVFLLAFPFHFAYDLWNHKIFSILFPVNESVWEHMKLLFTSYILFGIIEFPMMKHFHIHTTYERFTLSFCAIILIPIFLLLYLPVVSLFSENLIVTLCLMFIAITITKKIQFYFLNHLKTNPKKLNNIGVLLILLGYILFGILTYFPPKTPLFFDTMHEIYGIPPA